MSRHLRSLIAMIMSLYLLTGLPVARTQQALPGATPTPQHGQGGTKSESPLAQATAQGNGAEGETVTKVHTELVTLNVTVTDKRHNPVSGLDSRHFEVYEDKVLQKIEFFSNIDAPASIGIIFDTSSSMRDKLDRARVALKAFIETSHSNDDFFLIPFDRHPYLIAESTDGETAVRKLSEIEAGGSTALYDAAYLGVEHIKRGRHKKRALLIISDGQDNSSRYSYRNLRSLLKESDVTVYCIGIMERYRAFADYLEEEGGMLLVDLAKMTGGRAFFPRRDHELDEAVAFIAVELRRQYSIGYIPANFSRDGKWRKIKVRVKPPPESPRLVVRTREGYYAGY
jgi:Ca-activated chloride channel family protein